MLLQFGPVSYYKLGLVLLQIGECSYYRLVQPLLQNRTAVKNWGKFYCKLGLLLEIRAVITN